MKKTIYLISPEIDYKTFKKLHDKFVIETGLQPDEMEKILWEMLRDKQIYCWFSNDCPNDMVIGFEIPKGKITILSSPVDKSP